MKRSIAMAVLGLSLGSATADVITFDGLVGVNQDPYFGHTEVGFNVSPVTGEWAEAHSFGSPVPAIFGSSDVGVVEVTHSAGMDFTFFSTGMADAGNSDSVAGYLVEGVKDGSVVYSFQGHVQIQFDTFYSLEPDRMIDMLRITMVRSGATYNIDNINVTAVPAPASALGLLGLGLRRRRRPLEG